jgi:hypothetical protein
MGAIRNSTKRFFYQPLSFRTGDKHIARHTKWPTKKFSLARDIRDRFAAFASRERFPKSSKRFLWARPPHPLIKRFGRPSERKPQEDFRIKFG